MGLEIQLFEPLLQAIMAPSVHLQQLFLMGRLADEGLIPGQRCWSPPQQLASSHTALRRTGMVAGLTG